MRGWCVTLPPPDGGRGGCYIRRTSRKLLCTNLPLSWYKIIILMGGPVVFHTCLGHIRVASFHHAHKLVPSIFSPAAAHSLSCCRCSQQCSVLCRHHRRCYIHHCVVCSRCHIYKVKLLLHTGGHAGRIETLHGWTP